MARRQVPEIQSHQEVEVSMISISAGIYFPPGWPACHVTSHHSSPGSFHAKWLDSPSLSHSLPRPERQRWDILGRHHTLRIITHTDTRRKTHRDLCVPIYMWKRMNAQRCRKSEACIFTHCPQSADECV